MQSWQGRYALGTAGGAGAQGIDPLVDRGRQIFALETFGGNGRTCATCHPARNNYTIDPAYIATLPATDPLFVAEWNPALAGLERPTVMRQVGLVAVRADGPDKPALFRAVPSLSGLSQTIQPPAEIGRTAALGQSGDGAPPGQGLREFVLRAIADHMPRSLARVPGQDFRLPTEEELDALTAFMLSLGPQEQLDIAQTHFTSDQVEQGRNLFLSPKSGPCSDCHQNGGGLDATGTNPLFDVGAQHHFGPLALLVDPSLPGDGGYGSDATTPVAGGKIGYGDGRFNAPSLIEAADTAPYFHDNSAPTLKSAVFFYASPAFGTSPEGRKRPQVVIERFEVAAIAAFLRTLTALENFRSASARIDHAKGLELAAGMGFMRLAAGDIEDAFRALFGASGVYPNETRKLLDAMALQNQALAAATEPARNDLATRAVAVMMDARASMLE